MAGTLATAPSPYRIIALFVAPPHTAQWPAQRVSKTAEGWLAVKIVLPRGQMKYNNFRGGARKWNREKKKRQL